MALAEDQARDLAHGAAGRQPPRAAGARRRRYLLRTAVQGFPGDEGQRQAQRGVAAVLQRHPVYRHERHQAAVRQSESAPGGGLRDAVPEDHGRGAVRPRQSDVRRGCGQADRGRVAATDQIFHRHGQGQGAACGSRLRQRLRDHDFVRPEFRRRQRAALRAGAGEPRPARHQDHDQQGARRQLAHRAEQEGNAALHQRVLGLARLPRILLLLVLSRQQFRLQHHELQVAGDGQADRRRAHRGLDRRHRRPTTRTSRASSISPSPTSRASRCISPSSTSRCRRTSRAISTGSTAGSITVRW